MSKESMKTLEEGTSPQHRKLLSSLVDENSALRAEVAVLRKYRSLAFRDPLTGLGNRRYLEQRLHEEIDRAGRRDDCGFSIVVVDVDDFKQINDIHGHAQGDRSLCWVARFLEDNVREHDICCRTGGDEFAVLLPDADEEGCDMMVERLREKLDLCIHSSQWPIRLSLGAATWPTDGASVETLLEHADRAMYHDKGSRKTQTSPPTAPKRGRAEPTLNWGGPEIAKTG
ncbi:MAG: GGDEF domain-containing protein [Myxococcota bacterium]|nr:GGDEF domain-containing protein [Myxococcota bacterium]